MKTYYEKPPRIDTINYPKIPWYLVLWLKWFYKPKYIWYGTAKKVKYYYYKRNLYILD